jgi:hypothetical protein
VKLLEIVRIRLHQDGHIKRRKLQRVGHALLVAEVRQTDEDALDALPVTAEEIGTGLRMLPGLDGPELRRLFVEEDGLDIERGA